MPARSGNLHGNVADTSATALLVIDMINDFDWPEADAVLPHATKAARCIRQLKRTATKAGIPVIYVNDNFGHWQSNFAIHVDRCKTSRCRGHAIARMLQPTRRDYFVLKPKHSAFYATPLDLLLQHMKVRTLILTGISTESCILITAMDAFLRGYKIVTVSDAVASRTLAVKSAALTQMQESFGAKVRAHNQLDFEKTKVRVSHR